MISLQSLRIKNIGKNVNIGANSFLDKDVKIGKNSVILNNVVITGKVKIGSDCVIKSNSTIEVKDMVSHKTINSMCIFLILEELK